MTRNRVITTALVLLLAAALPLSAQEDKAPVRGFGPMGGGSDAPIHIVSDRLDADNKANVVVFIGNVTAMQEDAVLKCDRLEIEYRDEDDAAKKDDNQIRRITATGESVIVLQQERRAVGKKMVYDADAETVTLTGEGDAWPEVWENQDRVRGKKIIYDLGKDSVQVFGGEEEDRKINVVIFPKGGGLGKDEKKDDGEAAGDGSE